MNKRTDSEGLVAIDEGSLKIQDGCTVKTSHLESSIQAMEKARPGQMYITLDGGCLLPIEPSQLKSVIPPPNISEKSGLSAINSQSPSSNTQPKSLNKNISPSTLSLKQSVVVQNNVIIKDPKISCMEKNILSTRNTVNNKLENIKLPLMSEKEEIKRKVITEHEDETTVGQRKKLKGDRSTDQLNLDYDDLFQDDSKESKSVKDVEQEYYDSSESSVVDSEENESSTSDYIYEQLEDEMVESVGTVNQSEELESVRYNELYNNSEDSTNDEDEQMLSETPLELSTDAAGPTSHVKKCDQTKNSLQSNFDGETSKSPQNFSCTPQNRHLKRSGEKWASKKRTFPHRAPKINDKFPELPIPANINQYGDCLKTRLGRYHYGLTLNDPPCQFFQGVLKGASGQTLAAMFGDTNLISKFEGIPLDDIGHFAIDTTFKVIPNTTEGVNHVLTISLLHQDQILPLWYAIASCSSPELYKRIIIEFQQHILDWPVTSFLVNNDPVLCKAILTVFPDVDLYGSWFYYCYSIWKEVNLNDLVDKCKMANSTLMRGVKLLMAIPFLPPITEDGPASVTMAVGLEYVRRFSRKNHLPKEFNRVLDHVAAFWFNKVKTENFTVFGKHTCSLNYVEILQLSLLSYMKPNGNVWTLTNAFQSVARTANTEFNRFLNGKPPVMKRNRGKKYNVPIRQNIKKLVIGTINVKMYLERCTVYLEEMLDIFLHPLYPTTTFEKTNYVHTEGWKIRFCSDSQ